MMEYINYFNFVLSAVIVVVLMLFSRENLKRVHNILDILQHGSYKNCPYYDARKVNGRRWYDKELDTNLKGGDSL